jgi:chromate transporter
MTNDRYTQEELPEEQHDAKEPAYSSRIAEVTTLFLRLGFTAFGGPAAHVAMMRSEVVERRRWISNARFMDLIGVTNLIPGPSSTQLAIYLGYLRAGWVGLALAGICFICPAMLMVLAFAVIYVKFGALPQVNWLFYGIQPVVVAVVAQAIWTLGRTIFSGAPSKRFLQLAIALLVLILYLLGVNVILLLFSGALLYMGLALLLQQWQQKHTVNGLFLPLLPIVQISGFFLKPASLAIELATAPFSLLLLFLTFLKLGSVVYASGYTLLAFLRTDLVENLHWLTDKQLLDAISVGQFTPGPFFSTATFIGYLLAGWQGALVATLGIFLPSFLFIPLIHPISTRLRKTQWTGTLLDGVNAAALALMTGVLIQLAQKALTDILTWVLALLALGLLLRFKINSVWLILAGAAIGLLRFWLVGGG